MSDLVIGAVIGVGLTAIAHMLLAWRPPQRKRFVTLRNVTRPCINCTIRRTSQVGWSNWQVAQHEAEQLIARSARRLMAGRRRGAA